MTREESPESVLTGAITTMWPDGSAGVGVDLVDVEALTRLLDGGGVAFVEACWTESEVNDTRSDPSRLAARWAAKEAVMKALGRGIGELAPTDVEIVSTPTGAPCVRLHGPAAEAAAAIGVDRVRVSMTHESAWAAAVAVAVPSAHQPREAEVLR